MSELRAFLSYRAEDRSARLEFETTGLAGTTCRFAELSAAEAPSDWRRRYTEMIADLSGVIVLIGRSTAASEPIRWEIEKATQLGKRIAAVRIHNRQHPIPVGLANWPVLDWDPGQIAKELGTWLPTRPTNTTVTTI